MNSFYWNSTAIVIIAQKWLGIIIMFDYSSHDPQINKYWPASTNEEDVSYDVIKWKITTDRKPKMEFKTWVL